MYSSISTWNKLCKKLGVDPKVLPSTEGMSKEDAEFTVGAYQAKKIADAFNMIDTENGVTNDPYYIPYFYRDGKGGFSFYFTLDVDWSTLARSAARLWFKTRTGAEFAGKIYLKIYKKLG